jgi:23S rRNA pseudouridine2605 synthase
MNNKDRREHKKHQTSKKEKPFKKSVELDNSEIMDMDMRLNKYLAHSGVSSRRKSDEIIGAGRVKVNGEVVTEMGYRVKKDDVVTLDDKILKPVHKFIYLLLNKPHNVICTVNDEKGRKTVMDLAREFTKERVYPVGRLDRNTTGLILLTNDGDLAQKLSHPKFEVTKVYIAVLDKQLSEEHMEMIRKTITLDDGPAPVDDIAFIEGSKHHVVGIQVHIGRNRIVRRIFEYFGYEVKKLDRTRYAMLTKKNLPIGKCRHLSNSEVNILKYMMKNPENIKSKSK